MRRRPYIEGPGPLEGGLGWMAEGQWRALHDMLLEYEALARPVELRQAFDDRPLRRLYERGKLRWP